MTGLRTRWGISTDKVLHDFGPGHLHYLRRMAAPHLKNGKLTEQEGHLRLTEPGIFVSDDILSDLMYVG